VKEAKRALKKSKTILQMDELKCRKRVLRRLEYASVADVIETKGNNALHLKHPNNCKSVKRALNKFIFVSQVEWRAK